MVRGPELALGGELLFRKTETDDVHHLDDHSVRYVGIGRDVNDVDVRMLVLHTFHRHVELWPRECRRQVVQRSFSGGEVAGVGRSPSSGRGKEAKEAKEAKGKPRREEAKKARRRRFFNFVL